MNQIFVSLKMSINRIYENDGAENRTFDAYE